MHAHILFLHIHQAARNLGKIGRGQEAWGEELCRGAHSRLLGELVVEEPTRSQVEAEGGQRRPEEARGGQRNLTSEEG